MGSAANRVTNNTFVICPEIGSGIGGLADYTLRVIEQWPDGGSVQVIVPKGGRSDRAFTGRLQEIERKRDALLAALPASGGKVLLQYSAYGFDRFGYPRWLLRALSAWKNRGGGLLVVIFHEIWTFWPVLNRNFLVQQLHRRDIGMLLEHVDFAFTSTASQAQHLQALAPKGAVQVMPVGSNVCPSREPLYDRAGAVAVLFGLLPTRCRTIEAMRSELKSLARAGAISKIISIGAGDSPDVLQREHALLTALQLRGGFEQPGALAESEVSAIMLEAMFGISAQDERSITKSSTLMAYAAHGMNIISPFAGSEKPPPICWFTAPADLLDGIVTAELTDRAKRLRDWQQRTASWPHIAEQFALALQLPPTIHEVENPDR